jgi:hypothetical protein
MARLIPKRTQHGFVLFMTLIILVVMTISAVAMLTIMNSGTSAAANIAFRQASLRVADIGVEAARSWLVTTSANSPLQLNSDSPGNGYYAYLTYTGGVEDFSPATFDWSHGAVNYDDPSGASSTLFPGGYKIYYVIHRIARPSDMATTVAGGGACSLTTAGCAAPPAQAGVLGGQGQSQASGSGYNPGIQAAPGLVYYRVTIKVTGAKRNTSYVQAFFH